MRKPSLTVYALWSVLLASLFVFSPKPVNASSMPEFSSSIKNSDPVLLANAVTIHSEILNEDRTIVLRIPPKIKKAPQTPTDVTVLYILDAEKHFASAAASAAFFEASRLSSLGPAVVVGVVSTDRTRDFTPTASNAKRDGTIDADAKRLGGGADKFLAFLTTELRKEAEKRLPDDVRVVRRVLIGHSYGGLFTLHALMKAPQHFDAYVSLDPSLWWDRGKLARLAAVKGVSGIHKLDRRPVLYAAFASKPRKENTFHLSEGKRFSDETVATLERQGIRTYVRFFPDEVHGTVAPPAIFDALKVLFASEKPLQHQR